MCKVAHKQLGCLVVNKQRFIIFLSFIKKIRTLITNESSEPQVHPHIKQSSPRERWHSWCKWWGWGPEGFSPRGFLPGKLWLGPLCSAPAPCPCSPPHRATRWLSPLWTALWSCCLKRTRQIKVIRVSCVSHTRGKRPSSGMFHCDKNFMYTIKGETDHQPRLNAWDKCSGLVHWEDPEGWDGEGGGRGVQDGEHM